MTSPFGVNTNTSSVAISNRSVSRNSPGSSVSFCHWLICCTQFSSVPSALPSLYFQWAATPYSACLCISWVRICSSTGLPPGPRTVVCNDW